MLHITWNHRCTSDSHTSTAGEVDKLRACGVMTAHTPNLSTHCFMSCIWHSRLSCCVLRSWTSYRSLLRSSWQTLVSSLFTMDTWTHKVQLYTAFSTPHFLCGALYFTGDIMPVHITLGHTLVSLRCTLCSCAFLGAYLSVPSSWCAPTCACVPGGSTDVGTLCHLSQASPDRSAQCSPPYGNHLNSKHTQHMFRYIPKMWKEEKENSREVRRRGERSVLTHVELSNEACHVIVFKVFWKNFLGKASLIKHMETGPSLK